MQVDTTDPSLSNSTLMDPLNTTDSSPCMCCLSSLACLASVRSDHLPSCSLWHWCCSLTPDEICLSHSVDSSALKVRSPLAHSVDSLALSYTVRSPSVAIHLTEHYKGLAHVQIWNAHVLHFCSFDLNFWYMATRMQTDRQTYTRVLQCSLASVGLAQAHPN